MKRLKKLFFMIIVSAFIFISSQASGVYASSGELLVYEDVTLSEDHYGEVFIMASDVTLDGAGYSIIGSGNIYGGYYGVSAYSDHDVTIKNCNIRDFSTGMYVQNSDRVNIINNSVENCNNGGIALQSSDEALLKNNQVTNVVTYGISMFKCYENSIEKNTVYGCFIGFSDDYGLFNVYEKNEALNNDVGFGLNLNYYNLFKKNIIKDSIGDLGIGFYVIYSSDNIFEKNKISGSSWFDVYLEASSINEWIKNKYDTIYE